MKKDFNIIKNNGEKEKFDLNKIHKILGWASEGLNGVSISDVEMKASFKMQENTTTNEIHDALIKSASELISEETPNYQYLAANLAIIKLRKNVFGCNTPWTIKEQLEHGNKLNCYTDRLLEEYSDVELEVLESVIDHSRDFKLTFVSISEFINKYLAQNRQSKVMYETPQFTYMLQAMTTYLDVEDSKERLKLVINDYTATSKHDISLPTPIMAGLRTKVLQFSSCVLLDMGDSVDSISATGAAINKYVARKAGIGVNMSSIRAVNSEIRGGDAYHTGVTPLVKKVQADVKSFSQGGVRGGAATVFFPFWHFEIEDILSLKNEKGTEDNRARRLDYGINFNTFLYKRLLSGGKITLFNPNEVKDLHEAFYADQEKFEKLYVKYEKDKNLKQKKVVDAGTLFTHYQQERAETGRIYWTNVDHMNEYGNFKPELAPIKQSNLCVAPETEILTSDGYKVISDLVGQKVDVWNGVEWSNVLVEKTGTDQKLITVNTSDGKSLDCTEYHKFYIQKGYGKTCLEVRAHELKKDDKLIKFDFPTIDGELELENAYINGFYSADGCEVGSLQRIYLYHDKRKLKPFFGDVDWNDNEKQNRSTAHFKTLKSKFFVPDSSYTIQTRLDWLAGYLDGDGCLQKNGDNLSIVAGSIEPDFLRNIQKMLSTLGLNCKVIHSFDGGFRKLPLNDGSGEKGDFYCKPLERILITSNDLYKLVSMGIQFNRLEVIARQPQRDAKQFVKITSVVDNGRIDDTYCFNEPKRHMGVFNGLLTGQCLEIALPTKPIEHQFDTNGWIALCTLAAINMGNVKELSDLENICETVVRKLDAILDYQEYPVNAAKEHTELFRPLGVGVVNFAYWLAKNNLTYDKSKPNFQETLEKVHDFFEAFQFYLIKASIQLAKEKGACKGLHMTKWADGILPVDNYKDSLDQLVKPNYKQDWDSLREDLKKYGIRNSTLSACMPAETSAKISNATNGIEPVRSLVTFKGGKENLTAQVVPQIAKLKNKYDLLWDLESPEGYLELVAVMQKFICQSISTNTSYNPLQAQYGDDGVPASLMLRHQLHATKYGVKTGYYNNFYDGNIDELDDSSVQSDELDDCCKI